MELEEIYKTTNDQLLNIARKLYTEDVLVNEGKYISRDKINVAINKVQQYLRQPKGAAALYAFANQSPDNKYMLAYVMYHSDEVRTDVLKVLEGDPGKYSAFIESIKEIENTFREKKFYKGDLSLTKAERSFLMDPANFVGYKKLIENIFDEKGVAGLHKLVLQEPSHSYLITLLMSHDDAFKSKLVNAFGKEREKYALFIENLSHANGLWHDVSYLKSDIERKSPNITKNIENRKAQVNKRQISTNGSSSDESHNIKKLYDQYAAALEAEQDITPDIDRMVMNLGRTSLNNTDVNTIKELVEYANAHAGEKISEQVKASLQKNIKVVIMTALDSYLEKNQEKSFKEEDFSDFAQNVCDLYRVGYGKEPPFTKENAQDITLDMANQRGKADWWEVFKIKLEQIFQKEKREARIAVFKDLIPIKILDDLRGGGASLVVSSGKASKIHTHVKRESSSGITK